MVVGENTDAHHGTNYGGIPVAIGLGEEVLDSGVKNRENHLRELLYIFCSPSGISVL